MSTESQFNDRLIRFPELEEIFGVCKRTLRRQAQSGHLPPLQHVGRAVGMLKSQVDAHFEKLRQIKLKGA
jgi:predicted DNA-binding transcriptional regulator AlpA